MIYEEDLIKLAVESGFMSPESAVGLSGKSEFDESTYCEEYPVGENIKLLVHSLGITVIK